MALEGNTRRRSAFEMPIRGGPLAEDLCACEDLWTLNSLPILDVPWDMACLKSHSDREARKLLDVASKFSDVASVSRVSQKT